MLPQEFVALEKWSEVLTIARDGGALWYQAPFDARPRRVSVVKVFKNGSIRIDPLSNSADKFTADSGHLSRFRIKV